MKNRWENETLYFEGDSYFSALVSDLRNAKFSIALESYIFSADEIGKRIVDELCKASARGIDVRVLVDGVGSSHGMRKFAYDLLNAGVKTKVFHPPPWFLSYLEHANQKSFIQRILYGFQRINRRTHRKMVLIDHAIAYVGSCNVDRNHLHEFVGELAWRDSVLRVEGVRIALLERAFERSWRRERKRHRIKKVIQRFVRVPIAPDLKAPVRLNDTYLKRRFFQKDLILRILQSRQRVWITSAYFAPDRQLLQALKNAALGLTDVRVLLPKKSDVFFMPWLGTVFYYSLLRTGVRIFEYQPRMLHAKSVQIDDWAMVGSSNFNHRSWFHDLEADLLVTHEENREKLKAQFELDLLYSQEFLIEDWKARPIWLRVAGMIAFFLRRNL